MDVKNVSRLRLWSGELIQRSVKTLRIFNPWRRFHGTLPIQVGLLRAVRFSTVFQERIDKVLEFKTPLLRDDIICITNGTAEEHERELRDLLSEVQEVGYRLS